MGFNSALVGCSGPLTSSCPDLGLGPNLSLESFLEVILSVEKISGVRLGTETRSVDHHSGLLKSSWTRTSTQIALHIIPLQKDLISASKIMLFSSSVFTPLSSHLKRIRWEQHDAAAARAPRRVDGLCCLIVACADSPGCLALRSTLSQGCTHVRSRLGLSWRCD